MQQAPVKYRGFVCSKVQKPGLAQYKYSDKNEQMQYIWCNYDPTEKYTKGILLKIFVLLFALPVFALSLYVFVSAAEAPTGTPLTNNRDNSIVIVDRANVLDDTQGLKKEMSNFYKETGVTPALLTTRHSEWQYDYTSLSAFATEAYRTAFDDESHLLCVYSEDILGNNDFSIYIGQSALQAIPLEMLDDMTERFEDKLDSYPTTEALTEAFDSTETWYNKDGILIVVLGVLFLGPIDIAFILAIILLGNRKYIPNAVMIVDAFGNKTEVARASISLVRCAYCGGTFGSDVITACPHCNAPVTPMNTK